MIYHFITRDPAKCRIILTEPANLSGRAYSTAVCINPDCNHHPWIPRLTSSHTFHCFYSIIEWLEILPSDEFPNRSHPCVGPIDASISTTFSLICSRFTFLTLILSAPLKVSFISLHLNFLRSLAKYMWTYVVVTTFFRFF